MSISLPTTTTTTNDDSSDKSVLVLDMCDEDVSLNGSFVGSHSPYSCLPHFCVAVEILTMLFESGLIRQ